MPRQPEPSVIGTRPFRELSGPESAAIFAQEIIDRLHRLIDDPRFAEAAEKMFIKTGRFGTGACFPVVKVEGPLTFKVFTSLEAYRSNEKLPAPFEVAVNLQAGETGDDPQSVVSGTMRISREIGVDVESAVDKARLDAGLEVLAPVRNEAGYVENKEVPESQANPKSRKAKSRKVEPEEMAEEQQA